MSRLPDDLRNALAELTEGRGRNDLTKRSQAISAAYRQRLGSDGAVQGAGDALAYALARMPATFAAVAATLDRLVEASPDFAPASLLDVGCGPGTASFAAASAFPSLTSFELLDRNPPMLAIARTLAKAGLSDRNAVLRETELTSPGLFASADLVIGCYVLAEVPAGARSALVARLWSAARGALVLVEPGTPDGFARLREARIALIAAEAHVAAPCTHENRCPLEGEAWCRFLARVQRSRDHRLLKQGDRPFEDEPYAYLAVTREPVPLRPARRILGRPLATKAGVTLQLCGPEGCSATAIASRDRKNFKDASRLRWGDGFSIPAAAARSP